MYAWFGMRLAVKGVDQGVSEAWCADIICDENEDNEFMKSL